MQMVGGNATSDRLSPRSCSYGSSQLSRTAVGGSFSLGPQNLADGPVDSGRFLSRRVDHLYPFLVVVIEFGLRHQIRSLHHRFNGIAQIMCQDAESGYGLTCDVV
jgi:hypothetical protein